MTTTMQELELQTLRYAALSRQLSQEVERMESEVVRLRMQYLPRLRAMADQACTEHTILKELINKGRHLFKKPKSVTIAGVKIGLQLAQEKLIIADEEETFKLIKHWLKPQEEALIKTTEKLQLQALKNLDMETLKKIGCSKEPGSEEVIIKDPCMDKASAVIRSISVEEPAQEAALVLRPAA